MTDNIALRTLFERRRFDGVVHCAGVLGPIGPLADANAHDHWTTIDVNLYGTVAVCQAAIAAIKKRWSRPASVVLVAGGGDGVPNLAVYSATKAAVVRLAECLAAENEADNIRFNALAPGPLPGRMRYAITANKELVPGAFHAHDTALPGVTERAAACAVWLLSERSRHVNGRIVAAQYDAWPCDFEGELFDNFKLRRKMP